VSSKTSGVDEVPREIGDCLILRRSTTDDTEELVTFYGDSPWIRDLSAGRQPGFGPGDFMLVEDTGTGTVVSALNLMSQVWSYDGTEFGVGQVEMVATKPEYRRRGLIRAQMQVVHRWSAERGHKVQGITGIPWFYRQFEYEMALELGGGRMGYEADVPLLDEGATEPFRLRPATKADLSFVTGTYEEGMGRYLVRAVRDAPMWEFELSAWGDIKRRNEICIIETPGGVPVGFLVHSPRLGERLIRANVYELKRGVSWSAVTPVVLRFLCNTGREYADRNPNVKFAGLFFCLGTEHPVYNAMRSRLPRIIPPYAWYVRVPDLHDFLRHITPVLERRLVSSFAAGYSGELKLSFVQDGLRLAFEQGQLTQVVSMSPAETDPSLEPRERDAIFPGLIFLQLLFGFRSVGELEYAFPDCGASSEETRALLEVLFPKRPSSVWGLEA